MNNLSAGIVSSRVRNASKHAAVVALGVATLALFSVSASATSSVGAPASTVDFKDLDLSKQADAKRLYMRLRMAASEVCVGYPQSRGIKRNTPRSHCENAAVTQAVEAIGNPNLTALHLAKSDVKLAQSKLKPASNS
jgi:UrcA family protein